MKFSHIVFLCFTLYVVIMFILSLYFYYDNNKFNDCYIKHNSDNSVELSCYESKMEILKGSYEPRSFICRCVKSETQHN